MEKHTLDWTLSWDGGAERIPASVPGAAQLDYARAKNWPDWWYGENSEMFRPLERFTWFYRARLPETAVKPGERAIFFCGGVDYDYEVSIGGETVYSHEGMFTPFELDVTERAGEEIVVTVKPSPYLGIDEHGDSERQNARESVKPAVSYGWDWHPHLVPAGIWEETYIYVRPAAHIKSCEVRYALAPDYSFADVTLDADVTGAFKWTLADPSGNVVFSSSVTSFRVASPELWQPNGYGDAKLYTSTLEVFGADGNVSDARTSRVGFRTVELKPYENNYADESEFPKTRLDPPMTLTINGRAIFARGSNWVNPEVFPGTITHETYEPLVRAAHDANMNIFRIWGGGIVNKESFFDLCDELGILVWQEFPLACNNYPDKSEYLRALDAESRSIIRRLRGHACLALWCGGNELFNSWSGMTDQSLALRLLNRNCYDLDPHTPFIPTSPVMNVGHGCYLFRYDDGREVFEVMPKSKRIAYTEFGVPSPSDADILRGFIPENEQFPPRDGGSWRAHHAFGAWGDKSWLRIEDMESYFGATPDLETLAARGQWLQCEGYKCIFEEARRQKPRCSMAVNWDYNEPWPCAANNSLIQWPHRPKPALAAVAASCRPLLPSVRVPKFSWTPGETFAGELFLLNDAPDARPASAAEAFVTANGVKTPVGTVSVPALEPFRNAECGNVTFTVPDADEFTLTVVYNGVESEYRLLIKK